MQPKNSEFSSSRVLSESSIDENVSSLELSGLICLTFLLKKTLVELAVVTCFLLFPQMIQRPHSNSGPPCLEDLTAKEEKAINITKPITDQFINDIISSTPELRQYHGYVDAR